VQEVEGGFRATSDVHSQYDLLVKFASPLLVLLAVFAGAQDRLPTMPGYDRYADMRGKIGGSVVRGSLRVQWIDGGKAFLYDQDGNQMRYDIASGKSVRADDGGAKSSTENASRRTDDPNSRRARPDRGRQYASEFSKDGKLKAFYKDRNLWISTADDKNAYAVTKDGNVAKKTKFGSGSWVYGEELGQRDAMGWSPDGKRLWYYFFDESKVPDFYLAMNTVKVQDTLDVEAYPKAGAPNPEVDLYIYDLTTKKSVKVKVRPGAFDNGLGHYVYGMRWSPDSKELWFHRTNRKQDVMEYCAANPTTGAVRVIVKESWTASWTDNTPDRVYLDESAQIKEAPAYKGKMFWFSERNGFRNLYLVDLATGNTQPVTKNQFEVASIVRTDLAAGLLWYMGRDGENPYKLQLHRVGLDGSDDVRLTDPTLNHAVDLAPDAKHFIDVAEDVDTPPSTRLVDDTGKVLATLKESDITKAKELNIQFVERLEFPAADGRTKLYGTLMKPSNFDPTQKYPLIVQVYGGPESGTDQERFQLPNPMTELGYLVAWFDGRGTQGRGKAFKDAVYGKLGVVEIDDQAAGVKYLETRPYVDAKRVGIEGTSYGGYASALAIVRHPDVFQAACASSPVTDWRNYDSIYTERYMWIPQDNSKGYEDGSAMKYAADIKGRLMLFFGTADNNVHPNNTMQLVQALQRAKKGFELQVGPDYGHSGINFERMMEFFNDWLKR
jgi:dipeptidyl-peptidase-4